ncbi:MAG TPA: PspC domain-containing protein [bacterium]|nr:PspC domain-containing protein [bacterium]
MSQPVKRLYRSRSDQMIAGVCAGIAEYFNSDPSLIRILWLFFTLAGGSGIIAYIIAWIIIPEAPAEA